MNVVCTIKALYGEESYFLEDVKNINDIELTLQRALESICHDYDYIIKKFEFVDGNYIEHRKAGGTMEIYDKEKEIGYAVHIAPIEYDEDGNATNL